MKTKQLMSEVIFFSRWLQVPLYFGLMVAQIVYVYKFGAQLYGLITNLGHLQDHQVMLVVIGLIDVVMVANLLVIVIIGGYETFVAHLDTRRHPDHPEWLDHIDAVVLKIKLLLVLVVIASIDLLSALLEPEGYTDHQLLWKVVIVLTFVVTAAFMGYIHRGLAQRN